MKITGERPVDGVTPDGLVALHTSGYLEVARRIDGGVALDIGCGVGFGSSRLLERADEVVGLDYSPAAAASAAGRWSPRGLHVTCGDGAQLPLRSASVDWVVSSHIIEHFREPEHHVREIARVLRPSGSAFVFTPNPPMDLENPFHVHPIDPVEFEALLRAHFDDVWIGGHDAAQHVKDDFAARRRTAQRLLKLDVLDIRHRIPHRWYVALYSAGTRAVYRLQARAHAGGATSITPDDFFAVDAVDETTLTLFAIARSPRTH